MAKKNQTVGIPQALTYYLNDFSWEEFFKILGYSTVLSSLSTRKTFDKGFKYAMNDQCLPIKVFYGHILELFEQKTDVIFIPQIISLKKDTYGCPLVNAAPLLAKNLNNSYPNKTKPIWMIEIDYNQPILTHMRILKFILEHSKDMLSNYQAFHYYLKNFTKPITDRFSFKIPGHKTIGIIARSYVLNDPFLNNNIFEKLKKLGFGVETSLSYIKPIDRTNKYFGYKPVHWFNGETLVAAAQEFLECEQIAGVIFINYFGCGIDSFIEELFKKKLTKAKPYLCLSLDEHSGDAGINTRIEAFLDMIIRKEKKSA